MVGIGDLCGLSDHNDSTSATSSLCSFQHTCPARSLACPATCVVPTRSLSPHCPLGHPSQTVTQAVAVVVIPGLLGLSWDGTGLERGHRDGHRGEPSCTWDCSPGDVQYSVLSVPPPRPRGAMGCLARVPLHCTPLCPAQLSPHTARAQTPPGTAAAPRWAEARLRSGVQCRGDGVEGAEGCSGDRCAPPTVCSPAPRGRAAPSADT